MGLPGDLATHMEGAGFTAPYSERCAFTPIRTHTMYAHTVSGRSQGDMEAGSASIATPKGLESEVMGLPWDVATHIEVTDFTSCLPTCSTFTPSSNHTSGCECDVCTGRRGAWLASPGQGNVPLSPLPCSCPLRRQPGVLMSLQTQHPYKVWQTHQKYGAIY